MTTGDYEVHLEPLFGPLERMDLQAIIDGAGHPWFNQTLVQVGDVLVRLGVFRPGSFHWHQHDEQDEFFLVLEGRLRIELEGHAPVELEPRQAFCVPAGRPHRPVVEVDTSVIMLERRGVDPAGDASRGRPV